MTETTTRSISPLVRGDVLILFGELFERGYATGLRDAAARAGVTIIGSTMGQRDSAGSPCALSDEELTKAEANLGGRIINVPLVAGFDRDPTQNGRSPADQLEGLTLENWQDYRLNWDLVAESRALGAARFRAAAERFFAEADHLVPRSANVHFAHTMAGGMLRHKVFLAIVNRIYKGRGQRHLASQSLIESDLGRLMLMSFEDVTANTFAHLLSASMPLRDRLKREGGRVRYTAYGYHGTRVLIGDEYRWQTYTHYAQGHAKLKLESIARNAWDSGIAATVFNCPEIRTNSSDVFAGLELSLIPLLAAMRNEGGGPFVEDLYRACQALLVEGESIETVIAMVSDYLSEEVMAPFSDPSTWPMHNTAAQAEKTIGTSQAIVALHKSPKSLIGDLLSQYVVEATGALILDPPGEMDAPVVWLDHDVVARHLLSTHSARHAKMILNKGD